ncbi:MAG: retroviral-like aspartic protease family protein [Gemmataceae bacterium]|nr:retroviral-like aspartic protease family protein [Gemmataceae bacterium]
MIRLSYQAVLLDPNKPPPPSLPAGAQVRWRPLVRVRVIGPGRRHWDCDKALVDSGADDTLIPYHVAKMIGAQLLPDQGHAHHWRGMRYALRFARVELELTDDVSVWRWPALVAFSPAAIRYPLLGHCGFMEYIETRFLDADRRVELEPNSWYPGTT